jgi:hypothetical protein
MVEIIFIIAGRITFALLPQRISTALGDGAAKASFAQINLDPEARKQFTKGLTSTIVAEPLRQWKVEALPKPKAHCLQILDSRLQRLLDNSLRTSLRVG